MDLKAQIQETLTEEELQRLRDEEIRKLSVDEVEQMKSVTEVPKQQRSRKKNPFTEEKILGWLAEGKTKKQAAELSGITEQSLYNWIKADPVFKKRVENNLGGKIQLLAVDNVMDSIREGDVENSKWLLKNTKYFDKRYDPMLNKKGMTTMEANPLTGVLEVVTPASIPAALLGEEFVPDDESELDELEQALYEQDDDIR